MKKMLVGFFALAISVTFASAAFAQQQQSSSTPGATAQVSRMERFNGVIVKVDEATKDVLVQFHKEKMTFSFGDQTKIAEGSKALTFNDLKKGLWASIGYRKEGDKLMAERVHVSMPLVAKKETHSEQAPENK